MTSSDRLGITTRAFFLATVLGLTLAFGARAAVAAGVGLLVLAAAAVAARRVVPARDRVVLAVEGLVAGGLVGAGLPGSALLLPYLLVPALLAGVGSGALAVLVVVACETAGLALGVGMVSPSRGWGAATEVASPWLVASLGAGLVAVWVAQLRHGGRRAGDASYESARRLLFELHPVARRLSSGLDPLSIADQVLSTVATALSGTRAALFVRTDGGVLNPLGYRGSEARQLLVADDHLSDAAWRTAEPTSGIQASGRADTRHRVVLPLRAGDQMFGMVICEAASAPSVKTLAALMREIDTQAFRLDTALLFDEVRALATSEERQRVAREIHDGVAQEVASLGYLVDDLSAQAITEAQRTKLHSLRGEITRVVRELRLSIFDLRSEIAPSAGLGSALSDYVRTVGARSGLTVHLTLDEAPTRLRGEVETELLRIAQEAVTNARRHSAAQNLWVDCRVRPPYARITVEDDGRGLGAARPDSYGLRIMRERAERIRASLEIGKRHEPGASGTRVAVTIGHDDR